MRNKKVLITGVAGFIGSALARRLLQEGYTVVGVDNFLTGLPSAVPNDVTFHELDITDAEALRPLAGYPFDAILHLAAQTSGEISFEDPTKDLMINALGTFNLLTFAQTQNIPRFLYASSGTIYGDADHNPIPETQPPAPKSYYGITKYTGEQYVRLFSNTLSTTTLRMFNVYGPGQNMDNIKQGMVSIYLYYLMQGESILVKGGGDRFRDFVYIDDVVDAWVHTLSAGQTRGKVYNLASGTRTTVAELLTTLTQAWGVPDHPITFAEGTPGDAHGSQADISQLQRDTGWSPKVDLTTGVSQTVAWVRTLKR